MLHEGFDTHNVNVNIGLRPPLATIIADRLQKLLVSPRRGTSPLATALCTAGRQAMSRPLIELTLRRQVERPTNVKVESGCRVLKVIGESNNGAAAGICYRTPDGHVEHSNLI